MKKFKTIISGSTKATDFTLFEKKDLWTLMSKQVIVELQPSGSSDNPNPAFHKFLSPAGIFQMLKTLLSLRILCSFL